MVNKIRKALGGSEYGKKIAVFGLTFKPETDDIREAPSLTIIPALQEGGADIHAVDPQGIKEAQKVLKNVTYENDSYSAAKSADAVIIMTEWNEFRELDLPRIKNLMKAPKIVDARNVYDPLKMKESGFEYVGIGRL